mgnify:CR=1 FL=1
MIKILGVKINLNKREEVLEEVRKYLKQYPISNIQYPKKRLKPFVIFTPNPEIINYAQKDQYFKQIVNSAQINIPDGAGLCFAMEKKFHIKTSRLSGTDLMLDMCDMSSNNRFTIGLIGGRKGVALAAFECLKQKYPGLNGWAIDGPEVRITNYKVQVINETQNSDKQLKKITEKIIREKTDILFVALGFPKQEYFISQLSAVSCQVSVRPLILMGVGGAFDYISGRVKRAPVWMRKNGLEWMYRLIHEPWRYKRQIAGLSFFRQILFTTHNN